MEDRPPRAGFRGRFKLNASAAVDRQTASPVTSKENFAWKADRETLIGSVQVRSRPPCVCQSTANVGPVPHLVPEITVRCLSPDPSARAAS
jgi:hypothetical protein